MPDSILQVKPHRRTLLRSIADDTHWKCLMVTSLVSGCAAAMVWCRIKVKGNAKTAEEGSQYTTQAYVSPCSDQYVFIPSAFVLLLYLVYLVECWHSRTRLQICNHTSSNAAYEYTDALRSAKPVIWWKAICYHYVRRHRHVTSHRNGELTTTAQSYYERVNSGCTTSIFDFTECGGVTDETPRLDGLDRYPFTRIKISKQVSFQDQASQSSYDRQRRSFVQQIHWCDDYSEIREGLDFAGVEYRHAVVICRRDRPPWYATRRAYWLCSAVLMSWPLRLWIGARTAHVKLVVHKKFGGQADITGDIAGDIAGDIVAAASRRQLTLCYDAYAPEASRTSLNRPPPPSPSASQYDVAPSYAMALMLGSRVAGNMRRSRSAVGSAGLADPGDPGCMQRSSTFHQAGGLDEEQWGDESVGWDYHGSDDASSIGGSGMFSGWGKINRSGKRGAARNAGKTREESMRLLDPMPPIARVAPPHDYPVQRLQRLPRIDWPLDAQVMPAVSTADLQHDQHGLDDSSVADRDRHRDYGVTFTSLHSRTLFLESSSTSAFLDVNRCPAQTHEAPPPSYEESVTLRSLGRRMSQVFERLRTSRHTLLDEQL